MKTSIAFFIFNRPTTTEIVFEKIRAVKPSKLLVVADGPRLEREGELEKCLAARRVLNNVDWDCEVLTNYSDVNLGCGLRVTTGLNWVFEQVEDAIILEDDCVPHISFFRFCEELLDYYRNDSRIMCISGNNFLMGHQRNQNSYYFSRDFQCWGWASWRRAWVLNDYDMKRWPLIRNEGWLIDILQDKEAVLRWENGLQMVYEKKIDTWDHQWMLTCWTEHGLVILPNVNLISNIGYGIDATHTIKSHELGDMDVFPMKFPLIHPAFIIQDRRADDFTQAHRFGVYKLYQYQLHQFRTKLWKLKKLLKSRI
jgi:hypothetical protein